MTTNVFYGLVACWVLVVGIASSRSILAGMRMIYVFLFLILGVLTAGVGYYHTGPIAVGSFVTGVLVSGGIVWIWSRRHQQER